MPNLGGLEWLVVLIGPILFVATMVSVARSKAASGIEKAIWVLISLLVPVIGPILWFAIGKRSSRGAATQA